MVMVKALNLRLKDHRFDPRPLCFQVQATLNKLFTHTRASVAKQYNLVYWLRGGDALRLGR